MSTVTIIDYGSGNLRSAAKAFERVALPGQKITVTSNPSDLENASHIVLPGVGAFADCMDGLQKLPGMLNMLEKQVREKHKPFLGICVGMQMLFETGHEHGKHKGLGWLKGEVVKISDKWQVISDKKKVRVRGGVNATPPLEGVSVGEGGESSLAPLQLKIPHMGWNDLIIKSSHPLLTGITSGDHAYFVHSYYAQCSEQNDVLATVNYGAALTAIVGRDNILGTQFHPEKSQETGLQLIGNFLKLGAKVLRG